MQREGGNTTDVTRLGNDFEYCVTVGTKTKLLNIG